MDLIENPFNILRATPSDNRNRLVELAEEHSLLEDSCRCAQAQSILLSPRKRLRAEIAWLPGVRPKRVAELLDKLSNSTFVSLSALDIPPMAKANMIASCLSRASITSPGELSEWMVMLAETYEEIDAQELHASINEERIVSGFPEVYDTSWIEEELRERRNWFRYVIKSGLNSLPTQSLICAITAAVNSATKKGEELAPDLIADAVDSYDVEAQEFFTKETANIEAIAGKIRTGASDGLTDHLLSSQVDKLIDVAKNWNNVAQPILISKKSSGLEHGPSAHIAGTLRGLSIYLYNEHNKISLCQKLNNALRNLFAEVSTVADRIEQDAVVLEEARKRKDQWDREITYEGEYGLFFKKTLRISPEGIEWEKAHWNLDTITRVRWGGTSHYTNGIYTGTTYQIFFGNAVTDANVELKSEEVYKNFTDRLWKAVVTRLIDSFLQDLRSGKKIRFDNTLVDDRGVEIIQSRAFSKEKHVWYSWDKLQIWNKDGCFWIGGKGKKDLKAGFSYQETDNVHILEAVIRASFKRGFDQLSSLLGGE